MKKLSYIFKNLLQVTYVKSVVFNLVNITATHVIYGCNKPKNPSIVMHVAYVALVVKVILHIVINVTCAYPFLCTKIINALKKSIKENVLFVKKICFIPVCLRGIYSVVM